jgi:hypothetical protein
MSVGLFRQLDAKWAAYGRLGSIGRPYFTISFSWEKIMAKSQKKSNKEVRKPKAAKPKTNGSKPVEIKGIVPGLEHMKR